MISADNTISYFHNDHLGTPQKMTNSAGAIVWAADYLPFGQANVTVKTVENNLRFPSQIFDKETGLHYNFWRFYDPGLGRYLRADPIGLEGGINLYSYSSQNPVNFIDPFGLRIVLQGSASDKQILLNTLSNIAGTQMSMNEDGCVSGDFNSPKEFSEIEQWLKEIINSDSTVKVQFGDAFFHAGGKFSMISGTATLDTVHRNKNQEQFFYKGKPTKFLEYITGGPPYYYTREGTLAHELLGHGLDYVRGDYRNNQNDAVRRANKVREILGIPLN